MLSDDIAISVRNLTKTYRLFGHPGDRIKQFFSLGLKQYHREFTALKDVSLEIKKGETVGIIGRNGSGKSTLLQLICGILKPTAGTVQINGRISALLELGAGFNPEFTGRENVFFQGAIMGFTEAQMNVRFDEIAAFADIGEFIDQPVRIYSSGMFVRLAFAVAVTVTPNILIVDEALAVGDAPFQARCFAKFRECKARGGTVLFVTHSLDLITTYCDAAFLIDQGEVVASGNPKEVVDQYRRNLASTPTTRGCQISSTPAPHKALVWSSLFTLNPDENRYGSGSGEILEAGVFAGGEPTQVLMRNQPYTIRLHIQAHQDFITPVASFVVKDVKGTVLCGTTTLMERLELGPLGQGESLLVSFRQMMRLNPGEYLLSVGFQTYGESGYVPHDIRLDHLAFQVISENERAGIFDPESSVEWYRLGDCLS